MSEEKPDLKSITHIIKDHTESTDHPIDLYQKKHGTHTLGQYYTDTFSYLLYLPVACFLVTPCGRKVFSYRQR